MDTWMVKTCNNILKWIKCDDIYRKTQIISMMFVVLEVVGKTTMMSLSKIFNTLGTGPAFANMG